MANENRKSIETRIYDLGRALKKNPETNCYDEKAVDQFLGVWHELAKPYQNNTDEEISVVTVREDLRWAHTFGAYAQSPNVSEHCQEISVQARDELSGFIDNILNAVADKLDLPD